MSGSPKYTSSLPSESQRRLREERQRQAELERARREAEVERRRRQRLEEQARTVRSDIKAFGATLSSFAGTALYPFIDQQAMNTLQQRLVQCSDAVTPADEAGTQAALAELRKVQREFDAIVARAKEARFEADLNAGRQTVLDLTQQLGCDLRRSQQLDRLGLDELVSAIDVINDLLARRDLTAARRSLKMFTTLLQEHQERVAAAGAQWQAGHDAAKAQVNAARDAVAGLRVDPVVIAWCGASVEQLVAKIDEATAQIDRGDFAAAKSMASSILTETRATVSTAQEHQLNEDYRQYMVRELQRLLPECGWAEPSLAVEDADRPDSRLLMLAERPSGGAIVISLPHDPKEQIAFTTDGFPLRVEPAASGAPARTCDEAQRQIEKIQQALSSHSQIETDTLRWDGQAPSDRGYHKQTRALPASAAHRPRSV